MTAFWYTLETIIVMNIFDKRSPSSYSRHVVSMLFLLLCLTFSSQTHAQKIRFDHLSVKQGLSQGNVWDIYEDKLGFIWIATEDGLNLYDGYSFFVYRNNPADSFSISNNNIDRIIEDKVGNLWVATQN